MVKKRTLQRTNYPHVCPNGGKHAKQVKRSSGSDVRAYKEEFIAMVDVKRALAVEREDEIMNCFY